MLAKRMKPDKSTAKNAAHRALRAAARANARMEAVSDNESNEIETLKGQLDDLDYGSDLDTTEEYNIIKNRCTRVKVHCNRMAAVESNKTITFACAVCFDNCEIVSLRIITPFGHGFCEQCTDKVQAAAARPRSPEAPEAGCPTCRGPIASVIKAYF